MEKKVLKVKTLQRQKTQNWSSLNFSNSDFLSRCFNWQETVERRSHEFLSISEFRMSYESANRPLVITNCHLPWAAFTKWSFSYLHQKFGKSKLKCGQTSTGQPTVLKFEYFIEYLYDQRDDFPLYVFDDHFGETCSELLLDYSVPEYFPEDLFQGVKERPPFRWLLVGPQRSGSQVHQDPLGTSAWNVCVKGYKMWAMFPPQVPKRILKEGKRCEPFLFFKEELGRIEKKFRVKPILFVQNPGEVVFVPSKWWHVVLNLTDTIAVTQNYVSHCNFDSVWRMTRKQRKKFLERWKSKLSSSHPDLFQRGQLLDSLDIQ